MTVDLMEYSTAEWDAFLAGYLWGCTHGNAAGYVAAETDMGASHAHLAASIRKAACEPSHRDLVERRRRRQDEAGERSAGARRAWRQEVAS